jgi:hypothetical protein
MSNRAKLAREIAVRSEPGFIDIKLDIKPEPSTKLRRTNSLAFIEIPRERGGGRASFTEEQLTARRGGLSAEEYRRKMGKALKLGSTSRHEN